MIKNFKTTEKKEIYIENLDNQDRKFIHTKVVEYDFRTRSEGEGQNKKIIIYRPDFLTNERKTELERIIGDFTQRGDIEFYFDINTEQEGEFIRPLCEKNNIDFIQLQNPTKPKVIKRNGEVCWHWMTGTCKKGEENCEYEHKKTTVCKHWQKSRCKFQNTPEKCHNLHGKPPPKSYTEEEKMEKIQHSTWTKLPTNHIISQEDWYEYIKDVFTNQEECMERLVIPIEEIVGWEEDLTLTKEERKKHWYGEIPITKQKHIEINNPAFLHT